MNEKTVTTSPQATVTASFDDNGDMFISGVSEPDRILKKAEQEDGCFVSVGGLVGDIEEIVLLRQFIAESRRLVTYLAARPGATDHTATIMLKAMLERFDRGESPTATSAPMLSSPRFSACCGYPVRVVSAPSESFLFCTQCEKECSIES